MNLWQYCECLVRLYREEETAVYNWTQWGANEEKMSHVQLRTWLIYAPHGCFGAVKDIIAMVSFVQVQEDTDSYI